MSYDALIGVISILDLMVAQPCVILIICSLTVN